MTPKPFFRAKVGRPVAFAAHPPILQYSERMKRFKNCTANDICFVEQVEQVVILLVVKAKHRPAFQNLRWILMACLLKNVNVSKPSEHAHRPRQSFTRLVQKHG